MYRFVVELINWWWNWCDGWRSCYYVGLPGCRHVGCISRVNRWKFVDAAKLLSVITLHRYRFYFALSIACCVSLRVHTSFLCRTTIRRVCLASIACRSCHCLVINYRNITAHRTRRNSHSRGKQVMWNIRQQLMSEDVSFSFPSEFRHKFHLLSDVWNDF